MRKINPYIVITVILFELLLAVPGILLFVLPDNQVNSENRTMAEMPKLKLTQLDKFPHKFDRYVNDHFPFRSTFLHFTFLYSIKNNISPAPNVVIGKDDFLFCGAQERELYEGTIDFSEERMLEIVQELSDRQERLLRDSIRFYVVVEPTSYEIYPEYLPYYLQRTKETATDRFCRMMSEKAPQVPFIYLKDKMLKHKKNGRLYLKNDNHWNYFGGEYATEEILTMIAKDFPQLHQNVGREFLLEPYIRYDGNLHNMLAVDDLHLDRFSQDTDYQVHYKDSALYNVIESNHHKYEPTPGFSYPWEYERRFTTNRQNRPKIVVIRDSFGEKVMPFLSPWFRESLFIFDAWQYGSNDTIIQQEKPDIVLLLIYEPHIRNIQRK
jgi:hypothetical protein